MLFAGQDVHLSPVHQGFIRPGQHLLQVAFGFVELMLLQGAQPRLIVLHCLCVSWIFRRLFLGGYLQCHQTAFSSELKSKNLLPPRRRVRREKPFRTFTQFRLAAVARSIVFQSPLMIPARICRAVLPCLYMV